MIFMKTDTVKVTLYLAVQYIYNPTFHINCLIQIHIMLLSLSEFCKNSQREGHILLTGINEITLTCIL
jgi:hypothetical protein